MADESLFGELAVQLKLLDHGQLVDCLMKQQEDERRLGEIAIALGYLTPEGLSRILEFQKEILSTRGEQAAPKMPAAEPSSPPNSPRVGVRSEPLLADFAADASPGTPWPPAAAIAPAAPPRQPPRRMHAVNRAQQAPAAVATPPPASPADSLHLDIDLDDLDAPPAPPAAGAFDIGALDDLPPLELDRSDGFPSTEPQASVAAYDRQPAPAPTRAPAPAPAPVSTAPAPAAHAAPAPARPAAPAPATSPVAERPRSLERGRELVQGAIKTAIEHGASDLHLHSGAPPLVRIAGELKAVGQGMSLTPELIEQVIASVTEDEQWDVFSRTGEVDFAYIMGPQGRARVSAYRQQRGPDIVLRLVPPSAPTLASLNLPAELARLVAYRKGMILCTGPAGCGKSSTLAALLGVIGAERAEHILTVEDPIEYVFEGAKAAINQRQLGDHTASCSRALRAALREDPDVIAITELRDPETISLAMTAAETGHLVLGTLNTNGATQTINRIIYSFPADQQGQIRTMLSESLRAVISQRLVKRSDGRGRIPAMEVLVVTPAVANMVREGKTHQLHSTMQMGAASGMRLLDESLAQLVKSGVITIEQARRYATNPGRFA